MKNGKIKNFGPGKGLFKLNLLFDVMENIVPKRTNNIEFLDKTFSQKRNNEERTLNGIIKHCQ